jgi:DNA-binding beta-propeller fold protein YncE
MVAIFFIGVGSFAAHAEIVVTANDGKMVLENGSAVVRKQPLPDTVSVIDFTDGALKLLGEVPAPASVVGPPPSVAIAPDGAFALVTGAMKLDPADPTKTVPDDKLSVIDLKSAPPKVLATLQAGAGAAGVSINRAGTLALVANRSEGTVSVFTISGGALAAAGKIQLGDAKSGPANAPAWPTPVPRARRRWQGRGSGGATSSRPDRGTRPRGSRSPATSRETAAA